MTLPLILAEVADKEFTATTVVAASLVVSLLGYGLVRARKWLAPLAAIPAVMWALLVVPELTDRFVGPAILRELGYGYVVLSYLSVICPFITIGIALRKAPTHPPQTNDRELRSQSCLSSIVGQRKSHARYPSCHPRR